MCRSTARFLALGPGGSYEMAPPGTFAYYIRQATRALRDAFFNDDGVGWRGVSATGDDKPSNDLYDQDYWQAVFPALLEVDEMPRVLQLKADKQPADAIEAIIARPTRWRVDCDYMIQFANLY